MFTTDDMLGTFRREVYDPLEGVDASEPDSENLWKNAEILQYMTEAADAVARGTKSVYRTLSAPITAGTATVPVPRYVIDIDLAYLDSNGSEISPSNQLSQANATVVRDYGYYYASPAFKHSGRPQTFARDRQRGVLVLSPVPGVADTLVMECCVTLATPLLCGMPLPFLELPDQRLMLLFMKHLAYAKQDADTLDLQRSETFRARFDQEIRSREVEVRRQRRLPSPVRMEW